MFLYGTPESTSVTALPVIRIYFIQVFLKFYALLFLY